MLNLDYRPIQFKDVIGQDVTIRDLKNRSKDFSFSEVMFFQGHTGTGKTTIAKIVSSLINCENPIKQDDGSYEPCCECPACKDIITETFSRDVIMKDASDMGKQEVLDLERELNQSPLMDQNKIIIIEEAQQLASASAKGALLKILEKPRKNTYLILLTMDINKFNESIRKAINDRCQIMKFHKASTVDILSRLSYIVEKLDPNEDKFPDSVVELCGAISEGADGSFRKAIEDLDKCIYANIFTVDEYEKEIAILTEASGYEIFTMYIFGDNNCFKEISKHSYYTFYWYLIKALLSIKESIITGEVKSEHIAQGNIKFWKTGHVNPILKGLVDLNVHFPQDENRIRFFLTDYYEKNIMKREIRNDNLVKRRRMIKND